MKTNIWKIDIDIFANILFDIVSLTMSVITNLKNIPTFANKNVYKHIKTEE